MGYESNTVRGVSELRALLQRVERARVLVGGNAVSSIQQGLLILLCVTVEDGYDEAHYLAKKIAGLRIFEDNNGKMNRALQEVGGSVLAVSQFTLAGDVRKGRRPSFTTAAPPAVAEQYFGQFCELLAAEGIIVKQGVFGAHMQVELVNDGPVTLWLDTAELMSRA